MVYAFSSFMVDNVINCLDTGMWFLIKTILCRDYSLKYKYIDQRLVGQIGTKCLKGMSFPCTWYFKGAFFVSNNLHSREMTSEVEQNIPEYSIGGVMTSEPK
ncbi:uncharacterized protein BJ212DRAFT_1591404 [Suillus subaureus]|uniref:Uncharacterized protein n=1 Tax=Suillus subaureus TaxID=48587 RepID=A0A9P7J3W6_9AGAM|nr:uncharacterized protein BJ212DRAFT_1591404 [Suillus subaureus]KAG1801284.1 hypothetical protein BJ212DRAFT_1591404 [Suillus subaureus]